MVRNQLARDFGLYNCQISWDDNCIVLHVERSPSPRSKQKPVGLFELRAVCVRLHVLTLRNRKSQRHRTLQARLEPEEGNRHLHNRVVVICCRQPAYTSSLNTCALCQAEKVWIVKADKSILFNRRSELVSTSRHCRKHLLAMHKDAPP